MEEKRSLTRSRSSAAQPASGLWRQDGRLNPNWALRCFLPTEPSRGAGFTWAAAMPGLFPAAALPVRRQRRASACTEEKRISAALCWQPSTGTNPACARGPGLLPFPACTLPALPRRH